MRHPILLLALLGCGRTDSAETTVISNTPASIAEATFADSLNINLRDFQSSPSGLYWHDLTVGTGPAVAAGQMVTVEYDGRLPDGSQFDATRPGASVQFQVGVGRLIAGWDQGLVGMPVGTKRMLIVPPSLGYGPVGAPPVIPPNATLVFTVTVVAVQ